MIRYINTHEKELCRALWSEAFPEDSDKFKDYYFKEKTKDNRVLIKEIDGEIISMIHQNPYKIMLRDTLYKVDYVVGVATTINNRKQGHVRSLLCHMFEEMYIEGMPFCFLMAVDENIYLPFDFTYIFNQPHWKIKQNIALERRQLQLDSPTEIWDKTMLVWIQQWLKKNYQVYCFRDERYFKRLMLELSSESGELYLLYHNNQICGMQSFWDNSKKEQRMLLCESLFCEEDAVAKPAIMARIVNLKNFIKQIRLKDNFPNIPLDIFIQIEDNLILENNGIFLWSISKDGSNIQKQEITTQIEPQLVLTISQLTGWLFGYSPLEEAPDWCNLIATLNGVFLDEIV